MNAHYFAEWFRHQDHTVIQTDSSYWVDFGPHVYQAFPYHWLIKPSQDELNRLLKLNRMIGLRYSTPINTNIGHVSYHAVFENQTYDINQLSKWSRKNIRRGLRNCDVVPISFDRLAIEGWELQSDTLNRQSYSHDEGAVKSSWERRCAAAKGLPGFEAWGALVDGKLAASVITFLMDDCVYMLYQQCHSDFLAEHVNNALSYIVTETMVKRPIVKSILYGLHSLDAPASVDEFKFRMGYIAKPVRQRVVFHPWLAPLFNSTSHRVVKFVAKRKPSSKQLGKVEGMIRFYREGKRPLEDQSWPSAIEDQRPT